VYPSETLDRGPRQATAVPPQKAQGLGPAVEIDPRGPWDKALKASLDDARHGRRIMRHSTIQRGCVMSITIHHCVSSIAIALFTIPFAAAFAAPPDFRDADFYLQRGAAFLREGDIDHATVDFIGGVSQGDWLVGSHALLGNARLADENFQGAIDEYNVALKNNQEHVAEARRLRRDVDESVSTARQWEITVLDRRGPAYLGMKQYDLAIRDCERVISLEPTHALAQKDCANVYRELGNFTKALDYYGEAIRLKPDLVTAWSGRGRAYAGMGRYSDAISDCKKAIEIDAKSAAGLLCFGETYRAQGNRAAAIENYGALLEKIPFSELARSALADLTQNPMLRQKRVALVIGNSSYKQSPLVSTINDANDMAAALTKLGFAVMLGTNLNVFAMTNIFERFARRAKTADVALVFYSGHGAQYKEANYLVPLEDNMQWPRDAPEGFEKYINLQDQVNAIKNLARTRILIVDACRTDGGFEAIEREYGPDLKKTSATEGMFIAYASAPDHFSYDGGDGSRNSPFTRALLRNLFEKGLELRDLLTRVRNEAYVQSGKLQVSQTWDNMPNEFQFLPANADLVAH
jgi:tetratricopeptide (TPR) repeat protein